ncbi:hypothetical protein PRIPAC_83828 [Pristionchus pacificus]|uniref:C-type lectin n=1 Tax=Pristionchus pacificus TaxID=54126 RepID=A0A2A6BRV3_PRIPA|nr:hypothetical protein PRIPAC_83828 [Pristionchus pacificus]|eukprot:PDM68608.1 C-type lectin [Pristionchus pacificus]
MGMKKLVLLLFSILQIIHASCPGGFALVRDGQCRGQYSTITKPWDDILTTSISKCSEIQGQPVIIRNEEEQSYWSAQKSENQYFVLALTCNSKSKQWEWTDGSALGYKPPKGQYHRALDDRCSTGCSWLLTTDGSGYWMQGCGRFSTLTVDVFCTTQLQQPTPADDGCESFEDDKEDGVCYQIGEIAQNWRDAQRICRNFGADLATIHRKKFQANSFVRRLAVSRGQVSGLFLGAMSGSDNKFGWIDGSDMDYNNFYPGFPIAGLGTCLAMDTQGTSGQWVNTDCSTKQSVACIRPQNFPTPACTSGPWNEGDIIFSPGFPFDASTPCDFLLMVDEGKRILLLEANSCCDNLVLFDNYISGKVVANVTGEINDKTYTTDSSNFVRVSWQPNGGVNVRGINVCAHFALASCDMLGLLVFLSVLQLDLADVRACPQGFDVVANGQCRGYYKTLNLYWDERAVNTAISSCGEIDALPVTIHNAEQNQYWAARGWLVIGLVCAKGETKWRWTDGTPLDYRPPKYHAALDKQCKGGCSWDILEDGSWDFICNGQQTYKTNIYCTTQLDQPFPSPDGCDAFLDDRDDGICFEVAKTPTNFQEAQKICRSFGGFVASIHNDRENSFIRRVAVSKGATNGVYLGATVAPNAQSVKWLDGSVWNYKNFYSGFPLANAGQCVVMDTQGTSGQWVNTDCNAKQAVACERRQYYNDTTCNAGPFKEGDIIYSPGFPMTSNIPCDFLLSVDAGRRIAVEVLFLEANSCCDKLVLTENYIGGPVLATLTGEVSNKVFTTSSSNFMRVSWQPRGGYNVMGMMEQAHVVEYVTSRDLYWYERAVNTAISTCGAMGDDVDAVTIHNAEQQQYWTERGWLVIALICANGETKWRWTDGTPLDYKPPKGMYHSALDQQCKGGCSWDIKEDGYWNFICNGQETFTTKIYCTMQLEQPKPNPDGCDAFQDDRDDGICFEVAKAPSAFNEAQRICRSFGGFVASIHNDKENSFVRRIAVSKGATSGVYLGASVAANAQSVKWLDGSVWNYGNFYSGFPLPGLGECVAMDTQGTSGQWVNVDCKATQAVACERRQNYSDLSCPTGPFTEGDIIYSPGFPMTSNIPCDYLLSVEAGKRIAVEVLFLEANSCCDRLVLTENYIGGQVLATLTGEVSNQIYTTSSSNFMRVSWQPQGGWNVMGMMVTFRAV